MTRLREKSIGLYQSLSRAESIEFLEEKDTLLVEFLPGDSFHANLAERRKEEMKDRFQEVNGRRPRVQVRTREAGEKEAAPDPMEDPRVKSFLGRYPGRVNVRKPN